MPRIIECPSGLSGSIRGLKGKEADLFTSQKTEMEEGIITAIIRACWEETTAPGPYKGDLDWKAALTGDRYYAALQIRAETYKSVFQWPAACLNPRCGKRFTAYIDLHKDVRIQRLAEESAKRFSAGELFEWTLPLAEKAVKFHLQTGKDEEFGRKLDDSPDSSEQGLTTQIAVRVEEIEGIHINDKIRFLKECEMADLMDLLDYMDEVDCGVDTEVTIKCDKCGLPQPSELPLVSLAFWFPRRRGRGGPR